MTDHHEIRQPATENAGARAGSGDPTLDRLARVLRSPETLSAGFDARLMDAVRAAPHPRRAPARVLHLSPRAALAAAAGIALVAFLGGRASAGRAGAALAPAPHAASVAEAARESGGSDTVHVVRFVFIAPSAERVALVGDFNDWDRDATPLTPTGAGGAWSAAVVLPPGRHEYAFIVNGTTWRADPSTPLTVHDDFGTTSSIVTVGSRAG